MLNVRSLHKKTTSRKPGKRVGRLEPLRCPGCKQVFQGPQGLSAHIRATGHTAKQDTRPTAKKATEEKSRPRSGMYEAAQCPVCKREFGSASGLSSHRRSSGHDSSTVEELTPAKRRGRPPAALKAPPEQEPAQLAQPAQEVGTEPEQQLEPAHHHMIEAEAQLVRRDEEIGRELERFKGLEEERLTVQKHLEAVRTALAAFKAS